MACPNQCGCHNQTTFEPCTDNVTCYNSAAAGCSESPCAYAIIAKCAWAKPADALYMDYLTVLWRECLFTGEWSARTGVSSGVDEFHTPGSLDSGGLQVRPTFPLELGCTEKPSTQTTVPDQGCDDCAWSALEKANSARVWHLILDGAPPGAYPPDAVPSGTGANLVANFVTCDGLGNCTEVPFALYEARDTFSCLGRTEFGLTGFYLDPDGNHWPDTIKAYMPQRLCVVPYSSNWTHPCGTDTNEYCDCEDPGCLAFQLDITLECAETIVEEMLFTRITTGCEFQMFSQNLCGEISWPSNACGVFTSNTILTTCEDSDTDRGFIFLAYCDGGTWTLRTYCVTWDGATLTVDLADSQTLTRINVCEEVDDRWFEAVEIDVTGSTCCEECEETVPSVCCVDGIPTSLTATLASAGCAAANGKVVALTYVGTRGAGATEQHYWQGTFAVTGCGTLTFDFSIYVLTACEYSMEIFDTGGKVCWGDHTDGILPIAVDCDLTPGVSGTYTWGFPIASNCICCVAQSVTATVSA